MIFRQQISDDFDIWSDLDYIPDRNCNCSYSNGDFKDLFQFSKTLVQVICFIMNMNPNYRHPYVYFHFQNTSNTCLINMRMHYSNFLFYVIRNYQTFTLQYKNIYSTGIGLSGSKNFEIVYLMNIQMQMQIYCQQTPFSHQKGVFI